MSASTLPQWPPKLSDEQLHALTVKASVYALSHGLTYLPVPETPQLVVNGKPDPSTSPQVSTNAIHAPISLFPSPFPRGLFELAKRLQRIYNVLYARVALDEEFLDGVVGGATADDFMLRLWTIWKRLRTEGLVQHLHLGLFRSDYLLHAPKDAEENRLSLKQVEFNTISSSFGPLSERTAALHRHLYASTGYFGASPILVSQNFPPNDTTAALVEGLAAAHQAYNTPQSRILFVVQAGERNIFDQLWLEYALLEKHSIHVVRQTMAGLAESIKLHPVSRKLFLHLDRASGPQDAIEVSTVYFRAGYGPADYTHPGNFEVRYLLERSSAIKCPSIALQLAGSKKVQQVLTQPGVVERYLCDDKKWGPETFGKEEIEELRASWMEMWGLGEDDVGVDGAAPGEGETSGVRKARESASSLVLKPQREGGGNNIYKDAIPRFLDGLSAAERPGWIAMKLIDVPAGMRNVLVRADGDHGGGPAEVEVVSELGVFGWALFGSGESIMEKEAGWLVRTKGKDSDEGGVAAGFSVLDSLVLVDG